MKKIVSEIILTLLLIGMLTLAFNIQPVEASGTIYIRDDGSVDPPTAPIQRDGNVYAFTGDIISDADGIVVERDNIVIDGANYTLKGTRTPYSQGIRLWKRSNVTVKNVKVMNFTYGIRIKLYSNNTLAGNTVSNNYYGILLISSSNSTIRHNTASNNYYGIYLISSNNNNNLAGNNASSNFDGICLEYSSNNTVTGNIASSNNDRGIYLRGSSDNIISGSNVIAHNKDGINLAASSSNTISGNNITNNSNGITLGSSPNNIIHHNNFINNTRQVYDYSWDDPYVLPSTCVWDDGYPSGGNYWSDYSVKYPDVVDEYQGESQDVLGSDGIWDSPYEIDVDNQDRYPLVEPWSSLPRTIDELKTEIEECWLEGEIDNRGIVRSLVAKLNVAQRLVGKGKVEEAKTILADDFIPQVQNLTGIHITPEAADILIQSAEYILSNLQPLFCLTFSD